MANFNDSYCGIYCGACSIRKHGETGDGDAFIACCGSVPKSELACSGCKSKTVYMGCRGCELLDCAVVRGLTHCADCAEYPCRIYKKWYSAAEILPHVREAAVNLETIKRDGNETWLKTQEKRWSCPDCGAAHSWVHRDMRQVRPKPHNSGLRPGRHKKTHMPNCIPDGVQKGKKNNQPT
jgi:hypothetical protein